MFTAAHRQTLLTPTDWRLVAPECGLDAPDAGPPTPWQRRHSHQHPNIELLFVLAGGGTYAVDRVCVPLAPGTVILFDAFERHQSGYPADASPGTHLWVNVLPGHYCARVLHIDAHGITASGPPLIGAGDDVGFTLNRGAFGYAGRPGYSPPHRRLRLCATVTALAAELLRADAGPLAPSPAEVDRRRILGKIRRHIRDAAGNGVCLEQLARLAGYSKCHFHRLFREHYGHTVQQYVDDCRRAHVRRRLAQGAAKKQVTVELGFSSPASFSRWLRTKGPR